MVIDYYSTEKPYRADVDTGKFFLLYKGEKYNKIARSCGVKLLCEGKKINL